MKSAEKQTALALRAQGLSYNDILKETGVSKSTLSLWLRDIPLTNEQIAQLENKISAGREKFSRNERKRRDIRWGDYHLEAEEEYELLSLNPQFMFGLALYIGEGSKTNQNGLCLSNCDPRVIRKGLEFFRAIGIPARSMRCAIHLHPGLCVNTAERYWQGVTGLASTNFQKTTVALSQASTSRKGNVQEYGTCHIKASHTKIRQKLSRWMELVLDVGPLV